MRSIILSLFTLFFLPLAAQDPVQIALDHMGLEKYGPNEQLYLSYPLPGEPGKAVVVLPESQHGLGSDYDLHTHLLLVDEEKGEVIARSKESLTNMSEDYGPLMITKVTVDTFPYPISKNRTAFGVRVDYYLRSRYDPLSYTTLSLVEERDGFLHMVLAEDTIKIGLGVPMTGDYAPYAEWQGARCMAEMINADGGVNGMKIEVLTQDSGADTQTAISLAQKFLDEGAVMLGTIPFSDTMIPVAQIAAEYGATVIQAQSTQVEMHSGIVDNFITNV